MLAKCQYQALTGIGAGAEAGVGDQEVDPHQGAIGLPPQVSKIVVDVVKDTHLRSAKHIIKFAKGAKSRATSSNTVKQRTQGVPTNLEGWEQFEISRGPRDLSLTQVPVLIYYLLEYTLTYFQAG